jgi:hypothetical protein
MHSKANRSVRNVGGNPEGNELVDTKDGIVKEKGKAADAPSSNRRKRKMLEENVDPYTIKKSKVSARMARLSFTHMFAKKGIHIKVRDGAEVKITIKIRS